MSDNTIVMDEVNPEIATYGIIGPGGAGVACGAGCTGLVCGVGTGGACGGACSGAICGVTC